MVSNTQTTNREKIMIWTGRILSTLLVLMLILDCVVKFMKPNPVVESFKQLGYDPNLAFGLGVLLLTCTILYAIPRTAVLGAILLTGYLGGATATHVRVGAELFSVLFPGILGILIWGGLFLRDERVRALLPLRRSTGAVTVSAEDAHLAFQS